MEDTWPPRSRASFTIIGPIAQCREKMAAYARAGLSLAILSPPLHEFENVVKYVEKLHA